jgi:hypothetical protein
MQIEPKTADPSLRPRLDAAGAAIGAQFGGMGFALLVFDPRDGALHITGNLPQPMMVKAAQELKKALGLDPGEAPRILVPGIQVRRHP